MGGDPLPLRLHRPEAARQGGRSSTNDRSPDHARVRRRPDRVAVCAVPMRSVRAQAPDVGTEAQRESGKELYGKYCAQCHGEKGDGEGDATPHLLPAAARLHDRQVQGADDAERRAADPPGSRQHHQARHALHVDAGLARPHRPGRREPRVLHHDLLARLRQPRDTCPSRSTLPSAPALTNESVEHGKKLYDETGCVGCHGTLGRGDGPSAPTLKDDWDHPIRPADLTQSWTFRGGSTREDIFRTMSTGFNGTPMPAFVDALTAEQRWAITDLHRLALGRRRARLHEPGRRQARPGADRPGQGGGELRRPRRSRASRSSGRSWSPGARSIRPRRRSPSRRSTTPSRSPSSCAGTT